MSQNVGKLFALKMAAVHAKIAAFTPEERRAYDKKLLESFDDRQEKRSKDLAREARVVDSCQCCYCRAQRGF